ncbi:MAG TPA: TIGR04255 family protein, partial [Ktedonobacteraceae bacterium]|nr:TIGR04255 family protein [Ktedonobacteraceae bacterium]
ETIAPSVVPNATSIILDIDLFRQQIWQSEDQDIWDFLEALRHRKNDVFKASITKKTEELFN